MSVLSSGNLEDSDCQHGYAFEMEDGNMYCPTCDDVWTVHDNKNDSI